MKLPDNSFKCDRCSHEQRYINTDQCIIVGGSWLDLCDACSEKFKKMWYTEDNKMYQSGTRLKPSPKHPDVKLNVKINGTLVTIYDDDVIELTQWLRAGRTPPRTTHTY
jgi:ribosome-binding protein aMBF1 (putative translation factor)